MQSIEQEGMAVSRERLICRHDNSMDRRELAPGKQEYLNFYRESTKLPIGDENYQQERVKY